MIYYNRSFEHDALLLQWYQELLRSGDIDITFMPSSKPLGTWINLFRTAHLWFDADERGIWWAGWFEPAYGGVMYAMWCRADRRKSICNVEHTMEALEGALAAWGTVFGITKQPALLEVHRRLGYTIVADIPGLWESGSAWLVVLTADGFTKGDFHGWWQKRKRTRNRQPEFACPEPV